MTYLNAMLCGPEGILWNERDKELQMANDSKIKSFSDGDVRFWIEQETVHIKTYDPHGDPVELTENEAKNLALALLEAVREIESKDSN